MNKIPVMGTVSRAYGFLLGEIGTIVRLTWAPLLVASAFSYLYGGEAMLAAANAKDDPTAMAAMLPVQLIIGAIAFVGGIIATVALLRVVVFGDRKPGLFVYLWLGRAELRLIAVSLLLLVALIAAAVGVGFIFGLLGVLAAAVPVLGILLLAGVLALIFVAVWVPLRLSLIAPVVVAENNLGVERSWALTKGNALQMLLVLLLTMLPFVIVTWIAMGLVLGADLPALPEFPTMPPPESDPAKAGKAAEAAGEAFRHAIETWQLGLYQAMHKHWLEISILGFVGNVVQTALWTGVTGSAYTTLAGERTE